MSDTDTPRSDALMDLHGLSMTLERELTATKRKLADALADAASWQQQADARLKDAVEFGRRAEKAEARVKELEGLIIIGRGYFPDCKAVTVIIPMDSDPKQNGTLGEAMLQKA